MEEDGGRLMVEITRMGDTSRRFMSVIPTVAVKSWGPWAFGTILRRRNVASLDRLLVLRDTGGEHITAMVLHGLRPTGHIRTDWARSRWEPEPTRT